MMVVPVILCGGSGSRLWPLSMPSRPKPLVRLAGDESLFLQAVRRARGIANAGPLVIVAGVRHLDGVVAQLMEAGADATIIVETEPRNTGPAIAAAALYVSRAMPGAICAILASDQHIPDEALFQDAIGKAAIFASLGHIVTLGVRPTSASPSFGYIKSAADGSGGMARVDAFIEKPDAETAARLIAEGWLWNSGNFVAPAELIVAEMERNAPSIAAACSRALAASRHEAGVVWLGGAFAAAPAAAFDTAVMEKSRIAAVVPVSFAWSDLGTWSAVRQASAVDADGNAVRGKVVSLSSRDCLLWSAPGMTLAVSHLSGLAVVAEPHAVLVLPLDRPQDAGTLAGLSGDGAAPGPHLASDPPRRKLSTWDTKFRRWRDTAALPLWCSVGADHAGWGFHESLSPEGRPTGAARRARVQARQAHVFAQAAERGWAGPAHEAARRGIAALEMHYRRPEGLFRTLVAADGAVLDDTPKLYDQAFVLLALAACAHFLPDAEARALELLEAIEKHMANDRGGYRENDLRPFQSNPHMHLLEAALAWIEAGGGSRWHGLADSVAELALARMIDPGRGFMREFFAADWSPAAGEDGRIVEPGHQFEWAWLLERWSRLANEPGAAEAALGLYAAGRAGIDATRGVAVDRADDTLSLRPSDARLWPQTEWLKAALALASRPKEATVDLMDDAARACLAISRYISSDGTGLWQDRMLQDGAFVCEASPASTLYHLDVAFRQLQASVQEL